jgi:hypothetical protein
MTEQPPQRLIFQLCAHEEETCPARALEARHKIARRRMPDPGAKERPSLTADVVRCDQLVRLMLLEKLRCAVVAIVTTIPKRGPERGVDEDQMP